MKCPSCGAACADDARECPACGLLFAKWKEKVERERLAAEALLAAGESRAPAPPARRTALLFAGAAVLFWIVMLAWWYARHPARPRALSPAERIGQTVELRDPATGDLRRVRIERAGPPPPGAAAPPAPERSPLRESSWTETVSTGPAR